jgi:amino acid adenylation domain-containing protein
MQEVFALPLSFGQRRLWFLNQLEPGSPFYNILSAVRLSGNLNVTALEQSLKQIIRRHEILRTTFTEVEGEPMQIVAPDLSFNLSVIDLLHIPEDARDIVARQIASEKTLEPFDLENGSLLRAHLLRLGQRDHVILLVMHHIISDGWSVGVILREMASLYDAIINDKPSPLPDLPVQYADFAIWQQNWFQGEVFDSQLEYWKKQLGPPPVLELPTDRPRPQVQTYRGGTEYFALSDSLSESLKALSKQEGTTLFMTLLAAFNILLYRYTGQEDIIIGTAVTNRNRAELQSLIGFFVNTLAIRTDLSGDPCFKPLMRQVKRTVTEAFTYQDLPFEKLVDELQLTRDISRSPLFQIMFTLETAEQNQIKVAELELSQFIVASETTIFDLLFQMADHGPNISGALHYNTDLFNRDTIKRMLKNFERLLEALIASPDQRISLLPMLSDDELRRLLIEFNDTRANYPQNVRIDELFDAQVKRTPDAIALTFAESSLTYSELNDKANHLANHLVGLGVGPESLVAICVERSIEMVVGILGIIKSGAAYVPMDPAYPKERLAFMLADTGAPIILTQERILGNLPDHNSRVVCLDTGWEAVARETKQLPLVNATADNLAYIIYTSGSTGRPKGVAIEHRNAVALLYWARDIFDAASFRNVLASTSICFDLSVFELFVPLSWGGKVTLVHNALDLPTLASREDLTLINTVPSALQELLRLSAIPQSVRVVNLAGEALPKSLAERFYDLGIEADVFNLYGPSEDTTYSTYALIKKPVAATPPIGRPIANTQVYILDRRAQPVAIGVAGEIYIAGDGLARGYLNRPDLTAEKFLPDPFSSKPGSRLYRTGDLARYLSDGQIEFIGRIDHQIKIRGYRVELGEIEEVLRQHASIEEAAVIARGETSDTKQIVAYVISKTEQAPAAVELRNHLKKVLPDFMLPAAFVVLEQMPLTPNGKIDRRALPAPDAHEQTAERDYVPPRTPTEEVLAGIFFEVLGRDKVGIHDNFFDLGGHSLLATRVNSWVRSAFQIEMPLRCLFELPSIAELSTTVDLLIREGGGLEAPPITPAPRSGCLPLSFAQQRLWFVSQLDPETPAYNLDTIIRLTGELNIAAIERSLNEIVTRHEILRTTFPVVDDQPVQVIAQSANLKLSLVDLSEVASQERDTLTQHLIEVDVARPFDLISGPLLRVTLLRLYARDHIAICTMHHIISDGWSMGILIREMSALYEAILSDKPSPLRPLPVQYADFAVWQRNWLQGEVLEKQLAYWKHTLGNEPPVMQLPTDHPRPAVQTYNGSRETFVLTQEVCESLKQISRREGATLFMTLLAIFQVLLNRYAGQEVIVGADIANRNRAETEDLIGFFVNMMVLRADLSNDPSFRELLGRAREMALGAYAHQDLPFENLVDAIQPVRDRSRNPLFQVVFVLQNAPMKDLHLSGLDLNLLESSNTTAKFDMTLSIIEAENQLFASLEYNTDLFDRETIVRMINHFLNLTDGVIANLDTPISALPLLSDAEIHHLLIDCNGTYINYSQRPIIHEIFEAQAASSPDAIALVYEDQVVSYGVLNQRANQLAHFLKSRGVGPDVRVCISIERSVELIVGLLGILKAGGVYAPLDMSYPPERLAFMIEDLQAPFLLTEQKLAESLPTTWMQVICLDSDWDLISKESTGNGESFVEPAGLANIMYTSGSTGTPKGVCVTHLGVVRLAKQADYAEFTAAEKFLQFSAISFDSSTLEIWSSLLNGAQLVLPPPHLSLDGLGKVIEDNQISTIWLTSALFQAMVETQIESLRTVRQLLAGGDVLPLPQVHKVLEHLSDCNLVNGYGPTENTIFTCCYRVTDAARLQSSVPIGRPVANTTVYILDHRLQPVPLGVFGELYTGGDGLARGYHNRPEITAEKFIPNPFSAEPSARLYRTGDLARWLPSGDIEFLGRADQQVKIRGFRIELGEIETALANHPAIEKAVVIAREDVPGDKRLVAYLVRRPDGFASQGAWRDYLKEKLPEHMLPSAFVELDDLPYTTNGKFDRRALPAPDANGRGLDRIYIAPRNSTEKLLAEIWGEILQAEAVSIRDNFFDLGGDSILSIQVCARARNAGIRISMHELFEHQTIEQLAAMVKPPQMDDGEISRLAAFDLIAEADRANLPDDIEDAYPLVLLQAGMLFHSEYSPHTALYHDVISFHLRGPLDMPALKRAVERLLQQNDVLRTSFDLSHYSEPLQLVHKAATLDIEEEDLRTLSDTEQERVIVAGIEAEKSRKYDWQKAPLMRLAVSLRALDRFQLRVSFHHAILDGWSLAVMLQALFEDYVRIVEGETRERGEVKVKYREYVGREQEALREGDSLEYWRAKLSDAEGGKIWQWRRDKETSERVKVKRLDLSDAITAGLRRVAAAEGIGLKSVLLAAHLRVMEMISGNEEVVTGLVMHGRPEVEGGEAVLGLFLNTLPLRMRLRGGSWKELAQASHEQEKEMLRHRWYPMAQLQRELNGAPIFETLFNFLHFRVFQGVISHKGIEVINTISSTETNFTLTTTFQQDPASDKLELRLGYDATKISDEQARAISGYYETSLEAIGCDAEAPYQQNILSMIERQQLLRAGRQSSPTLLSPICLHERFARQARLQPEAVAVIFDQQRITYAALHARSNQLAHRLRRMDVSAETRVGLALERGINMVVGLLAVLKAGGAYVPMEISNPPERLRYIALDAGVKVVLSEAEMTGKLGDGDWQELRLDEQREEIATESEADVESGVLDENLAYVIYTSGSTGLPKGVLVTHRSVSNHLQWRQSVYPLNETDRFLQKAPLSFDISAWEILGTLLAGARLVLARPGGQKDSAYLVNEIREQQITVAHFGPAMLEMILQEDGIQDCKSLKHVFCGGEPLSAQSRDRFFERLAAGLHIQYGPTETTIDVTAYDCDGSEPGDIMPIGKPIANTQIYILDTYLQLAPVGVAGELYVAGDCLARGYLHLPGLTAEKFLPNPFDELAGSRLYRTGDRARYLPDGNIEYIGRTDDQVKIRGFRVELGEIESVLRQHPAIEEVIVTARGELADKRLVAYVVTRSDSLPSVGEWRAFLRGKLPDYMLPSDFVSLDALPLTPNGKVDRRALPSPDKTRPDFEIGLVAPRDFLELKLAGIWESLLGVKPIGVQDDFFNLGGHSLIAVRLMAKIQQVFSKRLPLNVLFQAPTIEQLANRLRQEVSETDFSPLVRIQSGGKEPAFFFAHPVGGNVMCYVELARLLCADQPCYAFQAQGADGRPPLPRRIEGMASHYIAAMREVQPRGPYWLGGWSMGGVIAFEMARQLQRDGEQTAMLVLIDSRPPRSGRDENNFDEINLTINFAQDLGLAIESFDKSPDALRLLTTQERLTLIMQQAQALNLLPADVDLDYLCCLFDVFKHNVKAACEYAPAPSPVRLSLLLAQEGAGNLHTEQINGWKNLAREGLESHVIPGNHYSMLKQPNVAILAARLKALFETGTRSAST